MKTIKHIHNFYFDFSIQQGKRKGQVRLVNNLTTKSMLISRYLPETVYKECTGLENNIDWLVVLISDAYSHKETFSNLKPDDGSESWYKANVLRLFAEQCCLLLGITNYSYSSLLKEACVEERSNHLPRLQVL